MQYKHTANTEGHGIPIWANVYSGLLKKDNITKCLQIVVWLEWSFAGEASRTMMGKDMQWEQLQNFIIERPYFD